jgi:hypothetical protein
MKSLLYDEVFGTHITNYYCSPNSVLSAQSWTTFANRIDTHIYYIIYRRRAE